MQIKCGRCGVSEFRRSQELIDEFSKLSPLLHEAYVWFNITDQYIISKEILEAYKHCLDTSLKFKTCSCTVWGIIFKLKFDLVVFENFIWAPLESGYNPKNYKHKNYIKENIYFWGIYSDN